MNADPRLPRHMSVPELAARVDVLDGKLNMLAVVLGVDFESLGTAVMPFGGGIGLAPRLKDVEQDIADLRDELCLDDEEKAEH